MVLGMFCLVYGFFRIFVKTEDLVKHISMFCGCRFFRAFLFDTFPLITIEVNL